VKTGKTVFLKIVFFLQKMINLHRFDKSSIKEYSTLNYRMTALDNKNKSWSSE
jgi:hypothetical protein